MNYTGRPSISGCRPVLSLYPTHRFCQYLLLIFITFTNSFLFNRAFSTNSRRPLSHAAGVTAPPEGEELNLSVIASQCHLPQGERLWQAVSFPVSFWRKEWYNGFAALPAHFMGREVKPNGVYFYLYPVRCSECSVLLHLQVA